MDVVVGIAGCDEHAVERSGLSAFITQVHGDAGQFLERIEESAYDLIFLDSERSQYARWWPHLRRVLRLGGLLIVDNATSHVDEMAPFVALVTADRDFVACLIPVGKGEYVPWVGCTQVSGGAAPAIDFGFSH